MKKLLITGATGFLGKTLTERLSGKYRLSLLGRKFLKEYDKSICESIIQHDLTHGEIPEDSQTSWDVVLHAAGKAHTVPDTESEKKAFFDVNLEGTRNLVRSFGSKLPRSFIYISSISVYGVESGEDIDEENPLKATDPYGLSKIQAELFLRNWASNNQVNLTILRLPLLAGPEPKGNLDAMIKGISSGRYLRIGNGTTRKSILWAEDIASITPELENVSGIFNLADGHNPSFRELEDAIARKLGRKVHSIPKSLAMIIACGGSVINTASGRAIFPLDLRKYTKITESLTIDDSKAKKELGWKPHRVVDQIMLSNTFHKQLTHQGYDIHYPVRFTAHHGAGLPESS